MCSILTKKKGEQGHRISYKPSDHQRNTRSYKKAYHALNLRILNISWNLDSSLGFSLDNFWYADFFHRQSNYEPAEIPQMIIMSYWVNYIKIIKISYIWQKYLTVRIHWESYDSFLLFSMLGKLQMFIKRKSTIGVQPNHEVYMRPRTS